MRSNTSSALDNILDIHRLTLLLLALLCTCTAAVYVPALQKAVIRATEDLSQDGDDKDESDDFALDTNDPDCQTWLYEHVHITRHMVHQAAAVFIPAMTEVSMSHWT